VRFTRDKLEAEREYKGNRDIARNMTRKTGMK
jgi:hypothetical protein